MGGGECPLAAVWSQLGGGWRGGSPGSGSNTVAWEWNIAAWEWNIVAWEWTAAQTAKWRASEQISWLPCSVRPGTRDSSQLPSLGADVLVQGEAEDAIRK